MISRPLSIAILAVAGLAAASQVRALGFGRIPESIPFGQSLDLSVPLRLDAGETLTPACLQAQVHIGEQRVPPGSVLITLEGDGEAGGASRLRIRSATRVQEPLVRVSLSLGCDGAVSRQFAVLADPPSSRADMSGTALPAAMRVAVAAETSPRPAPKGAVRSLSTGNALPRLEPHGPEPLPKAATQTAAAQDGALASAAEAASAAQAAARAAQLQLTALEPKLLELRSEAAANRAAMESMRTRLEQAEEQGRWWFALVAAIAALGTLALWLGWRVRAMQRERHLAGWQEPAEQDDEAAAAFAMSAPLYPGTSAEAAAVQPPPTMQADGVPTSSVSVDDLIDLEQQVEFFLVLGDEDAALELLQAHLRSTADFSPLPHLKLLDFHWRRGEREAYERTRLAVARRFDGAVPDWGADATAPRGLDDHPVALARLQARWPRPIEAISELQDLLFHRRGGDFLSLQAYRDALMLYSVARDLQRPVHLPGSVVDVASHRPTAAVDLDLSEAADPVSATLR